MGIEFLTDYIVYVVAGICLCIGYVIKNLVPGDRINRFIPLIVAVVGVGLNAWVNLAINPTVILGGMVSGLISTGLYELFHNFIKKE